MDSSEGLAFMKGFDCGYNKGLKEGRAEGFEHGQREVFLMVKGPDASSLPYLLAPGQELSIGLFPHYWTIRVQMPEERNV